MAKGDGRRVGFDVVCKKAFAESMMRECPHETVIRKFGLHPTVSIYTCKKCKYQIRYEFHGGIGCSYKKQREVTDE